MSLEKAIQSGKEKRKPHFRGTRKSGSSSCRNHGSCAYCTNSRLLQYRKIEIEVKEQLQEIDNSKSSPHPI